MAEGASVSPTAGFARYGEQPLQQTAAAAAAMRRLTGLLLAVEHPHPAVDDLLSRVEDWERQLSAAAPADNTPRIGADAGEDQRVYLSHAFDIGSFNPCFPEYRFDHLDAETASGRVTFPLSYEGPPGLVHGGFLAVFVDCVIQHQSCAAQLAGRTRTLSVRFRRPTPILTDLTFDIVRAEVERGITATVRLRHGDELLCVGEANTVAAAPEQLTGHQFGRRRPGK